MDNWEEHTPGCGMLECQNPGKLEKRRSNQSHQEGLDEGSGTIEGENLGLLERSDQNGNCQKGRGRGWVEGKEQSQ